MKISFVCGIEETGKKVDYKKVLANIENASYESNPKDPKSIINRMVKIQLSKPVKATAIIHLNGTILIYAKSISDAEKAGDIIKEKIAACLKD